MFWSFKFSVHLIENAELACPSESEILEVCERIESVITDTKEFDEDYSNFTILPNPFTDYVLLGSGAQSFDQIMIYDLQGNMVHQERIPNTSSLQLNTANYSAGIYVVHFMKSNERVGIQKMVKM